MNQIMRKASFVSAYKFDVAEIPKPEVVPGQVLIRTRYCSVCGSDVHLYKYDIKPGADELADSWKRFYGFDIQVGMGHQITGEVVAVGEGVESTKVGDRIAGVSRGGGFAEYTLMVEGEYTILPDEVTWEQASYLEPLNVAINAVRVSQLKLGDIIVVMGAGSIGNLVVQCARVAGAGQIIVVDFDERRIEQAKKMGAHAGVNPSKVDTVEEIIKLTNGKRPRIVYECTGNTKAINTMVDMLPEHGQGVIVSTYEEDAKISFTNLAIKSLNIQGILGYHNYFGEGASLVASKQVFVDHLYSSIVPLDKINEGMQSLVDRTEIGVIVAP